VEKNETKKEQPAANAQISKKDEKKETEKKEEKKEVKKE